MNRGAATNFWNFIANFYARQKVSDQEAYQYKLDATEKLLNKETVLLEFGCGTGSSSLYHAKKVGKIVAIDASQAMIKIATEKMKNSNIANVEFIVSDIESYQNPSIKFNVVLGLNVLHLIPNWEETILKISSLMEPGGYFISSTACTGEGSHILKALIPFGALGLLPKLQFFTNSQLEQVIIKSGFKILKNIRVV
ncbi:MAG: class I SAM-dependent methyltransferase [Oligoflexales bacterium]